MLLAPFATLFGYWFPAGALTEPPPVEATPEPQPEPKRPDVPTVADALAVLRKEARDTAALQPRKATAPPLIVIASYPELIIILDHVEALAAQEPPA